MKVVVFGYFCGCFVDIWFWFCQYGFVEAVA